MPVITLPNFLNKSSSGFERTSCMVLCILCSLSFGIGNGFLYYKPLKPFFEKHFPISPDWAVIPYYGGQFIFGWIGSLRRDCSRVIVLASFLGILGSALQTSATLKAFSRIATWLYTVGSVLCAVSFGGGFHGCLVCTLVLNKASVDRRIGLRSKDEKPRFQDMRFLKHVAFVHLVYFLGKLVWGVIVGWTHLDRWCSGSQNCFTIVHLWKMCNHAIPAVLIKIWPSGFPKCRHNASWRYLKRMGVCFYCSVKLYILVRISKTGEEKLPLFDNVAAFGHQPGTIQACKAFMSLLKTLPIFGFSGLFFSARGLVSIQQVWMNTTLNHDITFSNNDTLEACIIIVSFLMAAFGLFPAMRALGMQQPLKEIALICCLSVIGLLTIALNTYNVLYGFHGAGYSFLETKARVVLINGLDCHVTLISNEMNEDLILLPRGTTARDLDSGQYTFRAFAGSCPYFSSARTTAEGGSQSFSISLLENTLHTVFVHKGEGNSIQLKTSQGIKRKRFMYPMWRIILSIPESGPIPGGVLVHKWTGREVFNFTKNFKLNEDGTECNQRCDDKEYVIESCYQCELDHSGWYSLKINGITRDLLIGMYAGGKYDISVQRSDSNNPTDLYVVSSHVVESGNKSTVTGWMTSYILWTTFRTMFVVILIEFSVCEVPRKLRGLAFVMAQMPPLVANTFKYLAKMYVNSSGIPTPEFLLWASAANASAILLLLWMSRSFVYYSIRIVSDRYATVGKFK